MLLSLCIQLAALLPKHKVHPEAEDEAHKLWYWIEDNGEIVFPILGLLIVALIWIGIKRGMSTNVEELQGKQDKKDSIVRMMRAKLLVSAEDVAQELKVDHFMAAALCEELVKEGKLVQQRTSGGVANYRLKGL